MQTYKYVIGIDVHSSIIGVESTSIYHIPILNFLKNHGFKTIVINPCLVEKFSKLNLRPSKTDKKDASTSRQSRDFLYSQPVTKTEDKVLFELKIIAREREKLSKRIANLKDEIQRILSVLFPELIRCQIFTLSMLKLLIPTMSGIRRADKDILYHPDIVGIPHSPQSGKLL